MNSGQKKIVALACMVMVILAGQDLLAGNWQVAYGPFSQYTFHDVFFFDRTNGWIVGSQNGTQGVIFFNGTGSLTDWTQESFSAPIPAQLYKVYFVSVNEGWASGDNEIVLYYSQASGWQHRDVGAGTVKLLSVFFLDSNVGWASRDDRRITTTTAGGAPWGASYTVTVLAQNMQDIAFADTQFGWVATNGSASTNLWKSTDGGLSWSDPNPASPFRDMYGLAVLDQTHVWVAGGLSEIWQGTGGPMTWTRMNGGVAGQPILHDIAFSKAEPAYGWAVGESSTILHTTNSGQGWSADNVTLSGLTIEGVAVLDRSTAWAVGNGPSGGVVLSFACTTDSDCVGAESCAALMWNHQTCLAGVCTPQSTNCDDGNPCTDDGCTPASGCSNVFNTQSCDDGDLCTQTDTCQTGVCTGSNPVVCTALDQCHDVGTCDPALGVCSNPNKSDGTGCNDGDLCTQTDTCQAGMCTGSNPVVCTALDQCHDVGTCDQATGVCSNPNSPDGTTCNDGDLCTQTDTCQAGVCTGSNPVVCTALDQCHNVGTCDPALGVCSNPQKPDGTGCNDGSLCTPTDSCQAGVCTGSNPVVCTALDQCHSAGTCNPATGTCSNPNMPDGTGCNDGDDCTYSDQCNNGGCGGTPITCTSDACATRTCNDSSSCNVVYHSGASCDDGNFCNGDDFCDGQGHCISSGDPCLETECNTCQAAAQNCLDPDGAVCGHCNVCDGQGTCDITRTAEPGALCDDGNPCTQSGICLVGGFCLIEGTCDNVLDACTTGVPEVVYGTLDGETLDCRLPPDAVVATVTIDSGLSQPPEYVPVRILLANSWHKALFGLRLVLTPAITGSADGGGSPLLGYVPRTARLARGLLPVAETAEKDGSILFTLGSDLDALPTGDNGWQMEILLVRGEGSGEPSFEIQVVAPCNAAPATVGCHQRQDFTTDLLLPEGNFQTVSSPVQVRPSAGIYRSDQLSQPASSTVGCSCGAGASGPLAVLLVFPLALLGRFRRNKT